MSALIEQLVGNNTPKLNLGLRQSKFKTASLERRFVSIAINMLSHDFLTNRKVKAMHSGSKGFHQKIRVRELIAGMKNKRIPLY